MEVESMLSEAITIALLAIADSKAETNAVFNIDHVLLVLYVVIHFLCRVEKRVPKVKLIPIRFLPK